MTEHFVLTTHEEATVLREMYCILLKVCEWGWGTKLCIKAMTALLFLLLKY